MTRASAPTILDGTGTATSLTLVPWDDPDAVRLRREQQDELRAVYGDDGTPEPAPSDIVATVLLRVGDEPVACGSLCLITTEPAEPGGSTDPVPTAEVKRVYVAPGHRGRGLSRRLMESVEAHAVVLGFERLVLETGTQQPQAIGLYLRLGYTDIDNYGEWVGVDDSRCFAKDLGAARVSSLRPTDAASAEDRARRVTLEVVPWTDPRAAQLRVEMFTEGALVYPGIADLMADEPRYLAQDAELGAGTLVTILATADDETVGCASLQVGDIEPRGEVGELKRVFVRPSARRLGVATALLAAVEAEARARGMRRMVLQTGRRQPAAVRRYLALGYRAIAPYGPYVGDAVSLTFGKDLGADTAATGFTTPPG